MSIDGRVQEVIDRGEEADDILRAALDSIHADVSVPWSAIAFVEEGAMTIGPLVGSAPDDGASPTFSVPIVYRGDTVAGLWFGSETPLELVADLSRVAALLAPYCLVGWDTGGEHWDP